MKARGIRAANELRNASNLVLRGQRSGRIYKVPYTKNRYYQASAPGEAPAVRTGTLRASWVERSYGKKKGTVFEVNSDIHTNVKYARYLEDGSGRGMSPRPYRRRVQEKAYPKIVRIYQEPYDR